VYESKVKEVISVEKENNLKVKQAEEKVNEVIIENQELQTEL